MPYIVTVWYDFHMRRSVTVFPDPAAKEVSAIVETRKRYAKAFNMSVDCLVTNNSTSKRFLHKVQYERIKEECPTLPTGPFLQDLYSVPVMWRWKR